MSQDQLSIDDAIRYRAMIRDRLSQRNRIAAIVAVLAGPVPIIALCTSRHFPAWSLVALLAGPAAMLAWHIRSHFRPKVVCPNCGENWEDDGFLMSGVCEKCGLFVPTYGTPARP